MFNQLQPIVSGEANAVDASYQSAEAAQRAIFEGAQQRMDQLAGQRAQEAQTLSQQMGGPVAVGEFSAGVEPSQNALAALAPNSLMYGLANAQAGTQAARAYSEKVFPAMRTEQTANARGYFEDQVKTLRSQIDAINASSSSQYSTKLAALQKAERDYALQVAQSKLDKLKNDRDWQATRRTLANDTARLHLSQKAFGLQQAGVTGKYKGKPTLEARKLSVQEKQAAQKLGMDAAKYSESVRHHMATEAQARQRLANNNSKKAMDIIDAATGRAKGGMTITERRELPAASASLQILKNPKIYTVGTGKNKKYYIDETVHLNPTQVERRYGSGFANDPQKLYDLLTGSNIPNPLALKTVRARTGIGDFVPGKPVVYSHTDLVNVGNSSFNELRGIAIQRGFKPNPKHKANTQMLIDYIMAHNPKK
jgi:hypothetical protein